MRISDWSSDVCSSDLADLVARYLGIRPFRRGDLALALNLAAQAAEYTDRGEPIVRALMVGLKGERFIRSEEHTSELQSLLRISYAAFCLKKTKLNTY